jgi:hypothetical protein
MLFYRVVGFLFSGFSAGSRHPLVQVAAATARGDPFRGAAALDMVSAAMTDQGLVMQGACESGGNRGELHQQQHRQLQNCSEFSEAL